MSGRCGAALAAAVVVLVLCDPALATDRHVPGEYPTIPEAVEACLDGDRVLVADGIYPDTIDPLGKVIEVASVNGPESCEIHHPGGTGSWIHSGEGRDSIIRGFTFRDGRCGVRLEASDPTIRDCIIRGNQDSDGLEAAGINAQHSSPWFVDCIIEDNWVTDVDESDVYGGGIGFFGFGDEVARLTGCIIAGNGIHLEMSYYLRWLYSPALHAEHAVQLENCLIIGNRFIGAVGLDDFHWGGSVTLLDGRGSLRGCTIVGNDNRSICGGVYGECPITDSIVLSNEGLPLSDDMSATYCCLDVINIDEGNIRADPLFATGPEGDYYLSQTAAGQGEDSPCLDTGSAPAAELAYDHPDGPIPLTDLTTRTDAVGDQATVDMGFHYPVDAPTPTPEPTASPEPSPTPIPPLGVELALSRSYFRAGETFSLTARVHNPDGPRHYVPLAVVLDIQGTYWFWPGWAGFDFELLELPTGTLEVTAIEPFPWPDLGSASGEGLRFHGALLTANLGAVMGEIDSVEWGYGP